jgi:uncharacterized protein (DUF927 family)
VINLNKAISEEERNEMKDFEGLLNKEIKSIDNIIELDLGSRGKLSSDFVPEEIIKSANKREFSSLLMGLIKRVGSIFLHFNNLGEKCKISLFDKLMEYVQKFKKLLDKYGKEMGVESYSIDVGFPWGVSLSLTFKL